MTSKVVVRVLLLVLLQCVWCGLASAQSAPLQPSSCYLDLTANDLGIDLGNSPPPGAVLIYQNTVPGEGGESIYQVTQPTCPPAAAPSETASCPTCGIGQPSGGHPISLVTGNTFIKETDVRIPGLSGGLTLARTWNSLWPPSQAALQVGLFGPNWRSTYEERVFVGSDNYVKYSRSDGSFWSFACWSSTTCSPVAPANVTATLILNSSSTYWTLTFQNGEQRVFNYTSGSLISIIDRNGNATQLTYDSLNRLVTVADPGGRHLYFGYGSGSSYLVTGVTSDVGISLSYAYDSQGRLIQVTEPDLTTLSFTYNSSSLITSVTDSAGKVLEAHTYDSLGRGLTSTRSNGVDSITVSYAGQ